MLTNNHNITLQINKQNVDLYDDINITFQRLINDPTKIQTTNTTYSYSFDLPKSNNNCKIFNYANVPSKLNKFTNVYYADLYVDGVNLFSGSLKLTDVNKDSFQCNMYENKLNTIDTIFGESKMNEIDWKVDFEGVKTINNINSNTSTKYFFPLVSYGLFQKDKAGLQPNGTQYTPKDQIDQYTRFYYSSFVPSMSLSETLKKMCSIKGYELQGDIITDNILNKVFLSNYIDSTQSPNYNYGTDAMGKCKLVFSGVTGIYTTQTGDFGVFRYGSPYTLSNPPSEYNILGGQYNNFSKASYLNALNNAASSNNRENWGYLTEEQNESKMYSNGWINIPADGLYEIDLQIYGCNVMDRQTTITEVQEYDSNGNIQLVSKDVNLENMPIEFHIVKYNGSDGDENNISHELIYTGRYPNEQKNITDDNGNNMFFTNNNNPSQPTTNRVAVDMYNNPNFVCGIALTQWQTSSAYIKNGTSWNQDYSSESNVNFYNCQPYYRATEQVSGNYTYTQTEDWNKNELKGVSIVDTLPGEDYMPADTVHYFGVKSSNNGTAKCIVKLKKNDMLSLYLIRRMYDKKSRFQTTSNVSYSVRYFGEISVRAYLPDDKPIENIEFGTESRFDKQLNLGNFYNSNQYMKDFFNDVVKAFNLSYQQNGKIITLNTQKQKNNFNSPIDLDDRLNESEYEMSSIDFPKSLEVKFSVDTEEEGFYNSVPSNKINLSNWVEFGDYGSDKIITSNNDDGNELTQSLNFSHNWLKTFSCLDLWLFKSSGTTSYQNIELPVIAKSEWFVPGLKYEEYVKNDGRSLKQRMWFRQRPTTLRVPVNGKYDEVDDDSWVYLTIPTNKMILNNVTYDLTYKQNITNTNNKKQTLLTNYFNISYDTSSNIVNVECYLTPIEYQSLQKGTSVKLDSDLYTILEIQFDVSGNSLSKMRLMKL